MPLYPSRPTLNTPSKEGVTLEKNGERILERLSVLKDAIIQRQSNPYRSPPAESIPQPTSQYSNTQSQAPNNSTSSCQL
ncbi:hypothetical protein BDZ89DRAFT_1142073 [Hymenopellis radicata]|nr:hypothetical protein BDZ89DRAFT_1142073 [Hymenopellis radicata]